MKLGIYICLFLLPFITNAQQLKLTATVKDSQTGEALPYCNVSVVGTTKGTITNADGVFSISINSETDVLEFSFIGYQKMRMTAKNIVKNPVVKLTKESLSLQEITIAGNDDFLYSMLTKCRKNINNNTNKTFSKAYFGLESEVSGKPVEFLECYFNASLKGQRIIDLILKNGRLAHNILDLNISQNLETSKAIRLLNIIEDNSFYPTIPTQLGKNQMMKEFRLYLIPADSTMFHIGFAPKKKENSYFSGEYWIDKETMLLRKISLNIENANVYPFESVVEDKMDSINLNITITYKIINKVMYPELITFDYSYRLQRRTGAILYCGPTKGYDKSVLEPFEVFRSYNVKSVLYFYDFEKLFLAPLFEYDTDISDYAKLTLIPYNSKFWEYNKAMLLTEDQKRKINFINDENYTYVSKEDQYGKKFMLDEQNLIYQDTIQQHRNGYYTFWYPDKRVFIDKTMPNNKTATTGELLNLPVSSLIKLKAQILLDIIETEDSLICSSYTVFEDINSCYRMPIDSNSHAFVNIFFDLCEIERQKMQSVLDSTKLTLRQIKDLYEKTNYDIMTQTTNYLYDVNYGKSVEKLNVWNQYIYEQFGLDNIALFKDYYSRRRIRNDSIIESGGVPPWSRFE
ncbi:MAG TPA: carboxypeptidase-like regulatory domain-containing protein [Bacteroidales bacterium]|nr:carboxypeptidase-like regulatory domain-containing protein [Bacteroidales bacterium]